MSDKTSLLGTLGVHDSYHLSRSEKQQLAKEIREFAASRIAGQPCPSCLGDAIFGAFYDHASETLRDTPRGQTFNSGVAGDFAHRAPDFARHLMSIGEYAYSRAQEEADYEQTYGTAHMGDMEGED